jgi:hypothetical protein
MRTKMMDLAISMLVGFVLMTAGCGKSPANCKPGEQGCACVAQGCNGGLVCNDGTCAAEQHAGLSVDGAARSCEVLLADNGGKVASVDFGDQVLGRWLRQGDKVAAAFAANHDAPIGGGAVQVAFAGKAFSILNSHCYGARGEELQGATVHQ